MYKATYLTHSNVKPNFIMLKQKHFAFKSRSHARQELDKLIKKGLISNYRISWDTQLRMKVEVKHTGSIANQ